MSDKTTRITITVYPGMDEVAAVRAVAQWMQDHRDQPAVSPLQGIVVYRSLGSQYGYVIAKGRGKYSFIAYKDVRK